jgi:hypothetical protein
MRAAKSRFGVGNEISSIKMHDRFDQVCARTRNVFERLWKGTDMTSKFRRGQCGLSPLCDGLPLACAL